MVFGWHCTWCRDVACAPWLPSPTVLSKLLDWLRQPECLQSFFEYHTRHTDQPPCTWSGRIFDGWSTHTIDWNTIATPTSSVGCCQQCTILGGNVDVYYWPVPGANDECVSTIGPKFNDPGTELLVTDDRGFPYWKAQTNPWGQNGSQDVESITLPPQQALTGAINPLSVRTNIVKAREYRQSNIIVAGNVSSTEAIATIGDFRCTSPSICVGFSDVYVGDACGALSTDGGLIPYTIVAFAPGELSTVQIPAWVRASVPPKTAIRSFNFADLPCPPQSVMYAVEYKPALGEPYRPVLFPPRRLSSLLPEWSKSGCVISAALFGGVDPPRALKPADILTPRVTQVLPTASVAAPASGIRASEPSKTSSPSTVGYKEASIPSDTDTRKSGAKVPDPSSSDPKQVEPKKTDPKAIDSEDPNIHRSHLNIADPQDIRPSIPYPEITPAEASNPKPPNPENLDPKNNNSPSPDSQDIDLEVLDGQHKTEEAQGSTLKASDPDDPKPGRSSPDRSRPNVPESPSRIADSSNEDSKTLPSNDDTPHPSDSNRKDFSSSESQEAEEEAADRSMHNPESFNGESKVANFGGKDAGISHPSKSLAGDPNANAGDESEAKGTNDELDPFNAPPAADSVTTVDVASKTASTADTAPALVAAKILEKSGSALSSAASGLRLGNNETSDSKNQGKDISTAIAGMAKSSGSSSLTPGKCSGSDGLISAWELLPGFGLYVLPWLLIFL
ncbi:MAG: hypothetical protein Q9175_001552 [Cornicularia normoerica]